jgi:NADPH-dependent ferric siderophore reductase
MPVPASLLSIPGVQPLELEVRRVEDVGPRMRRIILTDPSLRQFRFQPGQDIMLVLGEQNGRPLSRRYTIRSLDTDAAALELNVVAHGVDGPGARWAASARPGTRIDGVGPRGKIFLDPTAEWHYFFGDESAAPVSLAMLEAVPANVPAAAWIEVTDAEDELPHQAQHAVHWLHRANASLANAPLLEALQKADLPAGVGHVYIAGEVRLVAALKEAALARGVPAERISAKAYWGLGRANATRGEPD